MTKLSDGKGTRKKYLLLAGVITTIYIFVFEIFIGNYYFVNDDYIIRDILSGRYSGVADAHIYNVIYPFALLIKGLFEVFQNIDIWAILMIGLIYICLFLILYRILNIVANHYILAITIVIIAFSCVGLYSLYRFSFTFTGAICGATALFLFATGNFKNKRWTEFLPSFILLIFSFCIRRDTFFMILPYMGVCALYLILSSGEKWVAVKRIAREVVILSCSCGILLLAHIYAFSGDEWQDFLEFRSLRITVHDYVGYPSWNDAKDFYEALGLSKEEVDCFSTLEHVGGNTVLDYSTDIRTILKAVGDRGITERDQTPFLERSENAFEKVISFSMDYPCLTCTEIFLVFMVLIYGIILLRHQHFCEAIFLILGPIVALVELLALAFRGRLTMAVSFDIVWIALAWVLSLLVEILCKREIINISQDGYIQIHLFTIVIAVITVSLWGSEIMTNKVEVSKNAKDTKELVDYCAENTENAYFQPALQIGNHTFRLGEEFDCGFNNEIPLGGWNATSPEYEQAMNTFCLDGKTIEEAIIYQDNVYIIATERYIEPIQNYLEWKYGSDLNCKTIDNLDIFGGVNVYDFSMVK